MRLALLLLFAFALGGPAQAQKKVYRCADAKGQPVFQQSPCGGNTAGSHDGPKAADAASAPSKGTPPACGPGSGKECPRQPGA